MSVLGSSLVPVRKDRSLPGRLGWGHVRRPAASAPAFPRSRLEGCADLLWGAAGDHHQLVAAAPAGGQAQVARAQAEPAGEADRGSRP